MYILIYTILVIVSYYLLRKTIRGVMKDYYDWSDVIAVLLLSLTVIGAITALVILGDRKPKPPKWL